MKKGRPISKPLREYEFSDKAAISNFKKASMTIMFFVFAAIGFISVVHQICKWIFNL